MVYLLSKTVKPQRLKFTVEHADRIFALQKKCPPATWQLDDEQFEIDEETGKIVLKKSIEKWDSKASDKKEDVPVKQDVPDEEATEE